MLFLPILKKDDIGQFEEQYAFSENSFSGPYIFEDRRFDEQMGVTQILLVRNPIYGDLQDTYLQHVVLSFFPDAESLKKQQSRLHISLFDDNVVEAQKSSHETYVYQRPQYYAAFLHSTNLPLDIRKALATDIFPQVDPGDEQKVSVMDSIFFEHVRAGAQEETDEDEEEDTPSADKITLASALVKQGYRLGSDPIFRETQDGSAPSETEAVAQEEPEEEASEDTSPDPTYKTTQLQYLTAPTAVSPFFTSNDFLIFE